ncbi:MAG TPA: hypothetical protein VI953_01540 [Candidatus Paceibacterota bacterium]
MHVTDDEIRASLDSQRSFISRGQSAKELGSLADKYSDPVIEHSKTCPECRTRTTQIILEGMFETIVQALKEDHLG